VGINSRSSSSLPRHLRHEEARASDVAARPVEAGDEAQFDWIAATEENDGNGGGCGLGYQRRTGITGDNGDLTANEVGRHGPQSIVLAFAPAIFDRNVPAFNVADLLQAVAECGDGKRHAAG
jgi:hypothetical protein